jgi:hypothetical protein
MGWIDVESGERCQQSETNQDSEIEAILVVPMGQQLPTGAVAVQFYVFQTSSLYGLRAQTARLDRNELP